ncbi:MAG: DJ-1 family protein [Elusimicrobia bacterium CG08_land_8_20_14_0_20_59_10]|nr:MAG: DJ-1 family protein [Elusimicrobia bacterium CG08_land_8_20_14_0_20_59_10]
MKKIAMFIAFQGFRDEEYTEPKKILEAAGHKVDTVSTAKGLARGKFRATATVDRTVDEINPADYDALTLVGGPGALEHLDTPKVHAIFRDAAALGKLIGAICISPVVLAHAGLLRGKKAACWPAGAAEVEKGGGEYTGAEVEVDGKLVTASGPLPAKEYGRALSELLK